MEQIITINRIKTILPNAAGIQFALLYGSFGRNEAKPNSDIDIQLLVDSYFNSESFIMLLREEFLDDIMSIQEIKLRNKIVIYFKKKPKVEFGIAHQVEEIHRNYVGSEITCVADTILYANSSWKDNIEAYLKELIERNQSTQLNADENENIELLADKFVYEFENCSTMHRRSDVYQFYFFYNLALHLVIQIHNLSKGNNRFIFLPKNFSTNDLMETDRSLFFKLNATLFLPEVNQQKRRLLDFFYTSMKLRKDSKKQEERIQLLEWIYERDYFWNFRDLNSFNKKIKPGLFYRSSSLSLYKNDSRLLQLLKEYNIRSIIDLRANREIEENPYLGTIVDDNTNYIKAPMDPWDQPQWFIDMSITGTNVEKAYRFFAIACQVAVNTVFKSILQTSDGAVVIHCYAGKDRTGIVITLLHLLLNTPLEEIYNDYLASESDVKKAYLDIVLNIIQSKGGIRPYLLECGLVDLEIDALIKKLQYGH